MHDGSLPTISPSVRNVGYFYSTSTSTGLRATVKMAQLPMNVVVVRPPISLTVRTSRPVHSRLRCLSIILPKISDYTRHPHSSTFPAPAPPLANTHANLSLPSGRWLPRRPLYWPRPQTPFSHGHNPRAQPLSPPTNPRRWCRRRRAYPIFLPQPRSY